MSLIFVALISIVCTNAATSDYPFVLVTTPEFVVNAQPHTVTHENQATAVFANGDFVAVYERRVQHINGNLDFDIFMQRFQSDGTKVGNEVKVNTWLNESGNKVQRFAQVAVLSDQSYVVVWPSMEGLEPDSTVYDSTDDQDGDGIGVYKRLFGADNNPLSDDVLVSTGNAVKDQTPARFTDIAAFEDGGYIIVYASDCSSDTRCDIFFQRYDASHNQIGEGPVMVNTHTATMQESPIVRVLPNGGFLVGWTDSSERDGDAMHGIWMQRFDANGDKVCRSGDNLPNCDIHVNTGALPDNQYLDDITVLVDGSVIVGFLMRTNNGDAYYDGVPENRDNCKEMFDVILQKFDSDLQHLDSQIAGGQSCHTQKSLHLDALPDGGYVAVWESWWYEPEVLEQEGDDFDGWDYGTGVWAQIFDSSNVGGTAFQVNDESLGNQHTPDVAVWADGTFVVSWQWDLNGADIIAKVYMPCPTGEGVVHRHLWIKMRKIKDFLAETPVKWRWQMRWFREMVRAVSTGSAGRNPFWEEGEEWVSKLYDTRVCEGEDGGGYTLDRWNELKSLVDIFSTSNQCIEFGITVLGELPLLNE